MSPHGVGLILEFVGVRFSTIAALCQPSEDATHILCHGYDGYTTNLPMIEAMKDDVLLVHQADGEALSVEHGGPVRMVTHSSMLGRARNGSIESGS